MLKRFCRHPGCTNFREEGHSYCTKHLDDEQMDFTGYEQPWAYLYHTKEWRDIKKDLLDGRSCELCGEQQATEIHHIFAHRGDETLFFDRDNLMPVCHHCHISLTAIESAERREMKRNKK